MAQTPYSIYYLASAKNSAVWLHDMSCRDTVHPNMDPFSYNHYKSEHPFPRDWKQEITAQVDPGLLGQDRLALTSDLDHRAVKWKQNPNYYFHSTKCENNLKKYQATLLISIFFIVHQQKQSSLWLSFCVLYIAENCMCRSFSEVILIRFSSPHSSFFSNTHIVLCSPNERVHFLMSRRFSSM